MWFGLNSIVLKLAGFLDPKFESEIVIAFEFMCYNLRLESVGSCTLEALFTSYYPLNCLTGIGFAKILIVVYSSPISELKFRLESNWSLII